MNAIVPGTRAATFEDWTRFMRPIAGAVRNTPAEADFRLRVAAIASAVQIPAEWLRQPWRQAEAMRAWQFFPSVHDVFVLFEEELRDERERDERRGRLALPAPEPEREELTPEQRAEVAASVRKRMAEMRGDGKTEGARPPVKPAPLSTGGLLAHYDRLAAEGNAAAAIRADAIRAQMGEA